MELRSLQSPTTTSFISSANWGEKLLFANKLIKFSNHNKKCSAASRKLKFMGLRSQSSGTPRFSSGAVEAALSDSKSKEENLVYVAGATGKVGSRTVRPPDSYIGQELLKLGFKVRAGVRSAQKAESLLQNVKQMKTDGDTSSDDSKPIEKLEIVECDLEKPEQIRAALGKASTIICCIGASEKEIFDVTGPYRIDYQATNNLIKAATALKVNHFILLTSLGTNKVGFPAAILNLFWGVLIWKRKAEEALLASGLPYTIVRPGGMERPMDAYKETHNITLSEEDTLFGGQVSNLQVAELMAYMASDRNLSYCKVVEVTAETTAPLTPLGDLLAKIPSQRAEVKLSKKPDTADSPQSSPSTIPKPQAPSPPVEEEPSKGKSIATLTRPLSPFTMYEDLKPPVSPIPNSPAKAVIINEVPSLQTSNISETPNAPVEKEAILSEVIKSRPLSPYTAYEDLKPPTSPIPATKK